GARCSAKPPATRADPDAVSTHQIMSQVRHLWTDAALRRSIANAVYRAAQPFLLNLISLPAMALIIRKMGNTSYGQWTTATTLVATFGFVTCLGLRGQFVRAVAQRPPSLAQLFAEQMGARIMLTFCAILLIMAACWSLNYSTVIFTCMVLSCIG